MSDHEDQKTRWRSLNATLDHPAAAVILALISFLAFTCMGGTVQILMTRGIPAGEAFLIRMGLNTILCIAYYVFTDPSPCYRLFVPSKDCSLFWFRAFAAACCLACAYSAMTYISLSEFMTLVNLRPFVVAFLCLVFIKEMMTVRQLIACVISFAAVLLVVQPEFLFPHESQKSESVSGGGYARLIGLALAMTAVVSSSFDIMICQKLGEKYSVVDFMFGYVSSGTLIAPIWLVVTRTSLVIDMAPSSYCLMIVVTLCGITAQLALVSALQKTTGTRVAIIGYFQIVFSVLFQTMIESQPLNLLEVVGMAVIMIVGVWCMIEKDDRVKSVDPEGSGEVNVALVAAPHHNDVEYQRVADDEAQEEALEVHGSHKGYPES